MQKCIKGIGICLFLLTLMLSPCGKTAAASDSDSVDSADTVQNPSPTPSFIKIESCALKSANVVHNGDVIEVTWEFIDARYASGVEICGVGADDASTVLAEVPADTLQWGMAVGTAEAYSKFTIRPYSQSGTEKRYGSYFTYMNPLKLEQMHAAQNQTFVSLKVMLSSGKLTWSILRQGDNGCSGFELFGRDRDGNLVLLADLPATATTYNVKEPGMYSEFVLRPYYLDGTERIYERSAEKKNINYTDGYILKDGIVGVQSHTQAQIRAMYKKLSPKNKKNKYKKKPRNKKPFTKGAVANSTLKNGLNTLNFVRYVAGISYDVKIKKSYQSLAQAAAVVNYNDKSDWISHYPKRPAGMSKALYKEGSAGSSSSNLGAGHLTLYDDIVGGWMSDAADSNIGSVGHRRWCLNPSMKYTGFGIDNDIYAMYSFDKSAGDVSVHGVHWPAENTPLELFHNDDPWSISMGTTVQKDITVTLVRARDKKQWVFTSKNKKKNGNYMNVNNVGYGQEGCIIFRPKSIKYKKGDKFMVTVKGTDFSFSYDVNFFSLR